MKKVFSLFLSILLLTVFPFVSYAEDTVTTTDDATTTEDETTTDEDSAEGEDSLTEDTSTTEEDTTTDTTTTEDETTSTDDTVTTTGDAKVTAEEDTLVATNEESSTETTSDSITGFLENIDTMWLWVILGIGGVVLIGSLIGILTLSKKEPKEEKAEEKKEEVQPKVEVVEEIKEEPAVQSEVQPQQEPQPTTIQDVLGNSPVYKQETPEADINKDLSDLNSAVQAQTAEPEVTTIPDEVPVVQTPTTGSDTIVSQVAETAAMPQTITPDTSEQVVPVQINPSTDLNNTPDMSTQTPQNLEQDLASQNLGNNDINQPVDTSSL
jgi:hypothetical protein